MHLISWFASLPLQEVDKFKEQSIRLKRVNELYKADVAKYQEQRKCQEDEREFLVRQMVCPPQL